MKKMFIVPLAAAAVVMAYSCAKVEKDSISIKTGTPVSFAVEDPTLEDEDPSTRLTISSGLNSGGKYDLSWNTGDRFVIYSFPSASGATSLWGYFTKQASDNKFHGVVPAAPNGTNLAALGCLENSFAEEDISYNSSKSRYEVKTNIPAIQDGTGLRYCLVGANPTYTDTYDDATDTHTYAFDFNSTSANKFYLKSALVRIDVPQTANVCRIDITHTTANTGNYFIVSSGDKKNFIWQASSNVTPLSSDANGSNSLTIYNSGAVLPERVLFSVFRTNSSSYGLSTLTFVFTNTNGKTATRVVKLQKKSDSSKINLSAGALNYLGEVTFDGEDFQ